MATAGGISGSQILEITECPICQESFNIPKVLPCIHTFCLHCLEKYGKDRKPGDKVTCPLCRREFKLELGFKELPNNYFILQLLQFNQNSTKELTEAQHVLCDLCCELEQKPPATVYCVECVQNLCQQCGTRHGKQRISKGHKVVSLNDKPSYEELIKMAPSYCDKHPNKEIEFYCYDCKMIACVVCYVDHKLSLHKCCDIRESAEEFREQVKGDIVRVQPYISTRQDEMKQIEEDKKYLKNKLEATKKEIITRYDQLASLLDLHKRQLTSELNLFEASMFKKLETRKEEVERQFVMLNSFTTYSEEMAKKGTPSDISRDALNLHSRAEELMKTQQELIITKLSPAVVMFKSSCESTRRNLIGHLTLDAIAEEPIACKAVEDFNSGSTSFLDQSPDSPLVHILPAGNRADFSSASVLEQSSVVHIIQGNSVSNVFGVAVVGTQVFVARNGVSFLEVYDSTNFNLKPEQLKISDNMLSSPRLAACAHHNYLYVKSYDVVTRNTVVYRVELSNYNVITSWTANASSCKSISVTDNYGVLVTISKPGRLHEYSAHGSLIREISLDIEEPQHCIQLSTGNFVVSHGGFSSTRNGICIVDACGQTVASYGRSKGSGNGQLNGAYQLSVDECDNVFVADYHNNRVLLFSPALNLLGNIRTAGHCLNHPAVIHFDVINRHLYIGEASGNVLVVE